MNAGKLIDALERFGVALPALLEGTADDDVRWRPSDGAWSILEVVRHLGDEEVDDFRHRLRSTLANPAVPWPPIDPEGWARARRYNDDDLDAAIARFRDERAASIDFLRALAAPKWTVAHEHPRFGPITAGDLLTAWAAHDALHLRQIAKRKLQLAQRHGEPHDVAYAGEW